VLRHSRVCVMQLKPHDVKQRRSLMEEPDP